VHDIIQKLNDLNLITCDRVAHFFLRTVHESKLPSYTTGRPVIEFSTILLSLALMLDPCVHSESLLNVL
jgi:hypothetical protein